MGPPISAGNTPIFTCTPATSLAKNRRAFSRNVGGGDISPVGKALLLRRVGDEVTVNAPAGVFRYQIRSIRWRRD
ncbi:MAG: GreA/GreB family elongation factor [Clostridia bacterium]|nr:GreA/GreB family elongation factor [Clostridia bacterium]MDH7572505.1 GreA/GreB family elongation factor [Clostridia bacterium]